MPAFRCSRCGADHGELPLSYAITVPDLCFGIPEPERESRVILGDETCSVDDRHFFLRGNIELALRDHDDTFVWTAWAEVERRDFKRALARWMRGDRVKEPPYRAVVATDLPCYPRTVGLAAELMTQPVGTRPVIRLMPGVHPLIRDQERGIDVAEVRRIAEYVLHGPPPVARPGIE